MFYLMKNIVPAVPAATRKISHVYFRYDAYKRKQNIRYYIEDFIIQDCKRPGGVDSQSAVVAEVMYVSRGTFADIPTYPFFQEEHATKEAPTLASPFTRSSNTATHNAIVYLPSTRRPA
jgi:hypothetical protein